MTDIVAGSVLGIRTFGIDTLGRLRSPRYDLQRYRSRNNEAICGRKTGCTRAGTRDCECGFWASFEMKTGYETGTSIAGIIRGYGKTVVGTRGFRSEKCDVVALVAPKTRISKPTRTDRFLLRFYGTAQNSFGMFMLIGILGIIGLSCSAFWWGRYLTFLSEPKDAVWMTFIALILFSIMALSRSENTYLFYEKNDKLRDAVDAMKEVYSDVPFYASLEDALVDFPVHPESDPTPFWERSADVV